MSSPAPRTRRKRNSLSLEEVTAAAIALVEAEGLGELTIRRVAERLRASPMSLYRYVADRDALLVAMLEEQSRHVPIASNAASPAERLRARFLSAHDFYAQHLWIPQILCRGDLVATSSFGFADACMGDLMDAGLTPAQALHSFGSCWRLLLGELLDRHPGDLGERPTQRERALLSMDRSGYPNYSHVLDNLDPMDGPPRDSFASDLGHLLHGIFAQARHAD